MLRRQSCALHGRNARSRLPSRMFEQTLRGRLRVARRIGRAADERDADGAIDEHEPLTRERGGRTCAHAVLGRKSIAALRDESQERRLVFARHHADRIVGRSDFARRVEKRATMKARRGKPRAQ